MRQLMMVAAAAVIGSAGAASAADLGDYRGSLKDEAYAPAIWSGFYIGVHAGAAWANTIHVFDLNNYQGPANHSFGFDHTGILDNNGFIGGGQIGVNVQRGSFVLGLEGEIGYLGIDNSKQDPLIAALGRPNNDSLATLKTDLYGTIAGRVGFADGPLLLYAKAGVGFVNAKASFIDSNPAGLTLVDGTSTSDTLTGFVVGGGIEYALSSKWSVKAEYLHFDLGDITVHATDNLGNDRNFKFDTDVNSVKLGVNYKFGPRDEPMK